MVEELYYEIKQLLGEVVKKLEDSQEYSNLSKESVSELNYILIRIKRRIIRSRSGINRQNNVEIYDPTISDEMKSILKVKEFQIGSYKLNTTTRMLTRFDKNIKLTKKEMLLLSYLCSNNNVLVKRTDCLAVVWKEFSYRTARSMDVYMCNIRKYLKDDASIDIINIHGSGYKITF